MQCRILAVASLAPVVALSLLAGRPASAATNLIADGSFENKVVTSPLGFEVHDTFLFGSTFGGWKVESGSVDLVGKLWQAADGKQSVDLNGYSKGTIYQNLFTQAGTTYQLIFAMSGNPLPFPVNKTMNVYLGSSLLGSFSFDVTGHSTGDMGWDYHSLEFTGTGDSRRLKFVSTTPLLIAGPALDNVSVTTTPEPCSLALLGTGAFGLLFRRRRQQVA